MKRSGFPHTELKNVASMIDASRTIGGIKGLAHCHDRLMAASEPKDFADKKVLGYKSTFDKEMEKHIKNYKKKAKTFGELILYEIKSKYEVKSPVSNYISWNICPDKTLLILHENKKMKKLYISARRQDRKISMNALMKKAIDGIDGAVGGGHIPAGGAVVPISQKEKFIEQVKKASGV